MTHQTWKSGTAIKLLFAKLVISFCASDKYFWHLKGLTAPLNVGVIGSSY